MNSLLLDLATSVRFFLRRRAAFVVAILTIALAIGANTAVFSILKSFLFSSIGVQDTERVAFVWTTKELPGRGAVDFADAYPNYKLLRETTKFWSDLAAGQRNDINWEQDAGTRRLQGARVTTEFFQLMKIQPALGRAFTPEEMGPNAAPVAIISHSLWRSAFADSENVLGQTLRLNGTPHTIVGVLPAGFTQPLSTEIWLPFDIPANTWTNVNGARQLLVFARLAPGVSASAANNELAAFAKIAQEADPANKDWKWRVQPLRENLLAGADTAVLFVEVGAAVLLLLAITNLTSLLLAWAAERQRETAVRLALGASAWRLVRQFLIQSVLLVSVGGGLGVALAGLSLPALKHLNPNPQLNRFITNVELDAGTLLFAATLVMLTGIFAGLLPAWQARKASPNDALRGESRGASLSRAGIRWQQGMVVVQAAISVAILVSAALAALSFYRLSRVQLGFATDNRVAFRLQFPAPAYEPHEKRVEFVRSLERNLAREPALERFGFTATLPVGDIQWGGGFQPQLSSGEFTQEPAIFHFRRISPGAIPALGIPLIEGRLFNERDAADAPLVVIVSKSLADKYWPGESAVGRKMRRTTGNQPLVEIVGVVGDVRDAGAGLPVGEATYLPWDQVSLHRGWVVLHGSAPVEELIAAGRRALHVTTPDIAAFDAATLETLAWQANAIPRLLVVLLGTFATIAVGITALGTYGVMSQLVANREREMAIRAALGATRGQVLGLVLRQNATLAGIGIVAGLGGAWLLTRWAKSQLTGLNAADWWPYIAVAALVLVLTQLAGFIPARRAARQDVQKALTAT